MTKTTKDIVGIISIIFLLLLLLTVAPLFTIAAINALFNTGIAYSFWTWLAMVWLQAATFGGVISNLVAIKNKL